MTDYQTRWNRSVAKLMRERYPEYDPERYYFDDGDIVTLNNKAKVVITTSFVSKQEVVVIKSSFGMKKGEQLKLDIKEFPYYKRGQYKKPQVKEKDNRILKWEVGDIVKDEGSIVLLCEENEDKMGFKAMMIEPREGLEETYPNGTMIYLSNPFKIFQV